MAKIRSDDSDAAAEALKDLLIFQLAMAGVAQKAIREIVGCDIGRVNRIARHLKATTKKRDSSGYGKS